jgi:predicted transcriptional regulator
MPKQAVFTMKLEPDLRADFMAAADAVHRPASQVIRELMREFVARERQKLEHSAFLERKVEVARSSMRADNGIDHDQVEAEFAARRQSIAGQA